MRSHDNMLLLRRSLPQDATTTIFTTSTCYYYNVHCYKMLLLRHSLIQDATSPPFTSAICYDFDVDYYSGLYCCQPRRSPDASPSPLQPYPIDSQAAARAHEPTPPYQRSPHPRYPRCLLPSASPGDALRACEWERGRPSGCYCCYAYGY